MKAGAEARRRCSCGEEDVVAAAVAVRAGVGAGTVRTRAGAGDDSTAAADPEKVGPVGGLMSALCDDELADPAPAGVVDMIAASGGTGGDHEQRDTHRRSRDYTFPD